MGQVSEKLINCRAYQLWDNSGQPSGRDNEFWLIARAELTSATERGEPTDAAHQDETGVVPK
jgi:hypothetical protein